MKIAGSIFGVMALAAIGVTPTQLQHELLNDWTTNCDTMVKIAEAMPENNFGFRATPQGRSYAEQILDVAASNVMLFKLIGSTAPAPALDQKIAGKAAIVHALGASCDFGIAAIKEQSDQTLLQSVEAAPFLGRSSRIRLVGFAIGHAQDVHGQMVVYLRLSGIVPPASRSLL